VNPDVFVQTLISGLLAGSVYALIAIGFTLVFGVLDIVNFAHGTFVMVAMYAAYLLFTAFGLDPYASLLLLVPLFFFTGVGVYKGLFRHLVDKPHFVHIVVTVGLMLGLENAANFVFGASLLGINTAYTTASLQLGDVSLQLARMAAGGLALLTVISLFVFLKNSDFGKSIRAAASNRLGAQMVGINVGRVYGISVGLSLVAAALAGAAIMPYSLASPDAGHEFLSKSFVIAVVGGLGSISGAFLGALIIGLVEAFVGLTISPSVANAVIFGVLIAVLLFKPTGLFGRAHQ
jgi:branched-chain amino acid transport system permease protein